MNLSLSNDKIRAYFQGSEEAPLGELVYVHSHPLTKDNFVEELRDIFAERQERVGDLTWLAEELGVLIPNLEINYDNAGPILKVLRKAYRVCTNSDKESP